MPLGSPQAKHRANAEDHLRASREQLDYAYKINLRAGKPRVVTANECRVSFNHFDNAQYFYGRAVSDYLASRRPAKLGSGLTAQRNRLKRYKGMFKGMCVQGPGR